MSLRNIACRWTSDYRGFYLHGEWITHRGGTIYVFLTVDEEKKPNQVRYEQMARELAWEKYEEVVWQKGALYKDYIIKGWARDGELHITKEAILSN